MQKQERILIVDQDTARANEIAVILKFLGYLPTAILPENAKEAPKEDYYAFMLGDCGDIDNFQKAVLSVCKEKTLPPIALIVPTYPESALPSGLGKTFCSKLIYPFNQNELFIFLHQCQICHEDSIITARDEKTLVLQKNLVGKSVAIQTIRRLVFQVASSDVNVLILGESGTGKEVVARCLHECSERHKKPFVALNCGAIPAELLESELFGHEKGAFTGAIAARKGRFELAEGGTLFLDEIGDMPLPMQVKLLRVLQERCFERVGGGKSIPTDVRVIAATHRNLEQAIEKGSFREDLFYRLNVFPIEMPALRERPEDLDLLVGELAARLERAGRRTARFLPEAIKLLQQCRWAGNVRELSNLVERLAILYPNGSVSAKELPPKYRGTSQTNAAFSGMTEAQALASVIAPKSYAPPPAPTATVAPSIPTTLNAMPILPEGGMDLKEYIEQQELNLIRQALDQAGGIVAQAAKILGMRRTTLTEKMRKFGIQREDAATEAD